MVSSSLISFLIIFGSAIFGLVFVLIYLTYTKAHTLVIRNETKEKKYIEKYLMSEKKEKSTGSIWWKSVWWQKKIQLPEPPQEVRDITKKGKYFVEVYRISEDEYVFAKDKGLNAEVNIQPFTEVQRQVVVNQFARAEKDRTHNFFKENGVTLTALFLMAMVIIVGLVYSGEILKGITEQQKAANSGVTEARNLIQELKSVTGLVQTATPSTGQPTINSPTPPIQPQK